MKINQDIAAEEARIELIPLIDVIFCILTFFILAALQLTRQPVIDVALPKAGTGNTQTREMVIVRLESSGQIFVYLEQSSPQLVLIDQLEKVLVDYLRRNPAKIMVLYADKDTRYNDVVQVLDRMREVGGDRVALATLPSADNPQPQQPLPAPLPPANLQLPLPPTQLPIQGGPTSGSTSAPVVPGNTN